MPSSQCLVLVTLLLSISNICQAVPTSSRPPRHPAKQHVKPGFFRALKRTDGKYKGSGLKAVATTRSTDFRKIRHRDLNGEVDVVGLPGYIDIQASEYGSASTIVIGNLVLTVDNSTGVDTDSAVPAFALDASASQSTQVWMAPYTFVASSPGALSQNTTFSGLQFQPQTFQGATLLPVSLRLPVFQASSGASVSFCASFPASAQTKSSLSARPCQNVTTGGVDPEGFSQIFWYDPSTGSVRPNWNSTAPGQANTEAIITSPISATMSDVTLASTPTGQGMTDTVSGQALPTAREVADELDVVACLSATDIPGPPQVTELHTQILVNLDETFTLHSTTALLMVPTQTITITSAITVPAQALEVETVTARGTALTSTLPQDSVSTGSWTETASTAALDPSSAAEEVMQASPSESQSQGPTAAVISAETAITTGSTAAAIEEVATATVIAWTTVMPSNAVIDGGILPTSTASASVSATQVFPTALLAELEATPTGQVMSTLEATLNTTDEGATSAFASTNATISSVPQNLTLVFTPNSASAASMLAAGQYILNATIIAEDKPSDIQSSNSNGSSDPEDIPSITPEASGASAAAMQGTKRDVLEVSGMGPGLSVVDPYELVFNIAA